ncbi:Glutamate decarboxylase and related PLP-dependent protein [alpha proteobacterium BAL199]|jgi:pimeloyl-ACP methyl ester carboxylesterase|nr:Glutamate decarboxylase and related PLP-dependent protein [alpha proteobacterium BAL199]
MAQYETDFGTVEALEWGDGDELLVLLHAAATGPRALADLAERLATPGRRVLVPALAGYGGTRVEGIDDPVQAHATVARWALDAGSAARRLLFGHSMGGLAAVLAADGRRDLGALVLYEPIVMAVLVPEDSVDAALIRAEAELIARISRGVSIGEPEAGIAAFVETWNEMRWVELPPRLRDRLVADAVRLAEETEAVAGCMPDPALWSRVTAPTMVLHGDRSPPLAARMATRLAGLLPAGRRTELAGLGHMAPALNSEAVAAAIETAFAAPPREAGR